MRFISSLIALACVIVVIGCSDVVAPEVASTPNISAKNTSSPSIQAVFVKYDGVDGECLVLEEALDVYTGTGQETCALLLPAVQKVREAAASMAGDADRDGNVDAKDFYHEIQTLVLGYNPTGSAYKLKDVIISSLKASGATTNGRSLDVKPYGKDHAGNLEFLLHHIFTGMTLELEDAGVDSRTIDAAMAALMAEIADLSDQRP